MQSLTVTLYEQDYAAWLETTAQLLRQQQFADLDLVNLVEEVEDMGRSEKRALYSNLKVLLMHLLKCEYQPALKSNSWIATIVEHQQRLRKAFQESPSLKRYYQEIFPDCYQDAVELAAAETGLPLTYFPSDPPFSPEDVLAIHP
jgi:hypothetical protein